MGRSLFACLLSLGACASTESGPRPIATIETIVPGAEDVIVVSAPRSPDGYLLISCDDRRIDQDERPQGAIYGVALDGSPGPDELTSSVSFPFHPHGMGFWPTADRTGRLFVVNHRGHVDYPHTIEVFDLDLVDGKPRLAHVRTIWTHDLEEPNDVTATSADGFIVSNLYDGRIWGIVTRTGNSFVSLCTDLPTNHLQVLDDGLLGANGVHYDAARGLLFVTESLRGCIRSYQRLDEDGGRDGRFDPVDALDLGGAPDNISQDGLGLLVAVHSSAPAFFMHRTFGTSEASRIVRVRTTDDGHFLEEETLLAFPGGALDAASTAVACGDELVVGSVYGRAQRFPMPRRNTSP